jgi:hypothetical protein
MLLILIPADALRRPWKASDSIPSHIPTAVIYIVAAHIKYRPPSCCAPVPARSSSSPWQRGGWEPDFAGRQAAGKFFSGGWDFEEGAGGAAVKGKSKRTSPLLEGAELSQTARGWEMKGRLEERIGGNGG